MEVTKSEELNEQDMKKQQHNIVKSLFIKRRQGDPLQRPTLSARAIGTA